MRTSKLKSFQSILPLVILGVALLASVAIMIDRLRISEPTSQAATPADFLQAQGKDLMYRGQKVVLRGVNFDNIGALGAGIGTNNVNDVKYIEQDYQTLSAQGGNHARFGMAYTWWANDKTKFYQVMDAQVALARKHNIFLTLLTFTNPDGGDGCYEGYSEHCSLWTNTTYQNQLKDFWIDVATHYKDEPAVAGYDLVNEPTPPGPNWCTTWFNYAQTLRNAVAAVAPNQLVFIEACSDPTFDRIFKEPNGTKAKNVVYEVHDYEPMEMSHPGYNGSGNAKTYPGNATVWTNEGVQKSFYFDKSTFAGTRYPGQYSIAEDFSLNWANQNDVPLYIGEWGAQGFLNGHNQYYKDKGEVYRDLGINHAYYTWRHDVTGGWRWGLYNSSGALVAPDQAKLDAARTSWANSVKPSFSTTNTPSPQPSASVVPTATPGVSPTPTPTPTPTPSPSTTPGPTGTLRVQGMSLAQGSNRFIVEGVNIEFFRDPGCSYITTGQYPKRTQIAQKMKDLGINAVRFNYSLSWLGQSPANMTQFLDMMQAFTQKGIYVMPSDHAYTGKSLSGRSASYPLFKQIIEGARAKGFEQYLIMNPYNEPGPQDSWSVWATANKDTLTYLRNTAGFKGVVVLDTLSWAAAFDSASQLSVRTHDGTLLNGTPNVMFANHWYPNISISSVNATVNASNTVPVVIGELGQINPGSSGLDPGYVSSVFSSVINTGIPKGHNGIFAWMWNWCDENGMTEDDFVTLNTYGNLNVSGYYSKVNGGTAPTPTPSTSPTPGVSPTPTPTPTPTPVPTGSLTVTQGVKFTASGSLITATAKYKNNTNQPITTTRFAIASRPPGGTNDGGPYYDFEPYVAGRTLAAGQEVTITATRTFTASDPDGGWYAYPTYELSDGSWIDGPVSSYLNFNVSANGAVTWNNQASPTPTPVPSPSPSPTPTPIASVSPTPSPTPGTKTADFNNDGKVDLRDYGILVVNFFHSGANQPTDLNSDGIVDLRDYTLLVQQFHL